jgi:quinone-modifying oxidoreductase subunit QmoB
MGEFAHLGFGELPDVVTNAQFERWPKAGKITRPSDGKSQVRGLHPEPGQDNDTRLPYAGAVTSLVALKQATYVREDYPKTARPCVSISTCAPRSAGKFLQSIQQDPGIFLTKGEVVGVSKTATA